VRLLRGEKSKIGKIFDRERKGAINLGEGGGGYRDSDSYVRATGSDKKKKGIAPSFKGFGKSILEDPRESQEKLGRRTTSSLIREIGVRIGDQGWELSFFYPRERRGGKGKSCGKSGFVHSGCVLHKPHEKKRGSREGPIIRVILERVLRIEDFWRKSEESEE